MQNELTPKNPDEILTNVEALYLDVIETDKAIKASGKQPPNWFNTLRIRLYQSLIQSGSKLPTAARNEIAPKVEVKKAAKQPGVNKFRESGQSANNSLRVEGPGKNSRLKSLLSGQGGNTNPVSGEDGNLGEVKKFINNEADANNEKVKEAVAEFMANPQHYNADSLNELDEVTLRSIGLNLGLPDVNTASLDKLINLIADYSATARAQGNDALPTYDELVNLIKANAGDYKPENMNALTPDEVKTIGKILKVQGWAVMKVETLKEKINAKVKEITEIK